MLDAPNLKINNFEHLPGKDSVLRGPEEIAIPRRFWYFSRRKVQIQGEWENGLYYQERWYP